MEITSGLQLRSSRDAIGKQRFESGARVARPPVTTKAERALEPRDRSVRLPLYLYQLAVGADLVTESANSGRLLT
jgi:hypothetical protein